jgi:serine/threonine-protein kinase PknG
MRRCQRAGCDGVIELGYCSRCGLAPKHAPGDANAESASALQPPSHGKQHHLASRIAKAAATPSTPSTRSSTRVALSGGYVTLPPLPPQDPISALIPNEVPEEKRRCSSCGGKVAGETGYCPKCAQEYAFTATLKAGDLVAGKYEVKGAIAFGGLGWIYLAFDTVLSRWVILKGLLNSKDPAMINVAVREREFLASVKHRSIVGVYDFILQGREGFIVMEYVRGKTLLTLRKENRGPLPVFDAICYVLDLLPAFAYLHDSGLVYCDFKPENAMVEGTNVKLIDMGAVRRIDDKGGDIFGTKGFVAPEASNAPSPASDLYTVARTLAVLVADFDYQWSFADSLPGSDEVTAFASNPSLLWFLMRATRVDPANRFQNAEQFAEQLLGVLRDVAGSTREIGHVRSTLFEDDETLGTRAGKVGTNVVSVRDLPNVRIDPDDPAASAIIAAASITNPEQRLTALERIAKRPKSSLEAQLRVVDELISADSLEKALNRLEHVAAEQADAWRVAWRRGALCLAQQKGAEAATEFETVFKEAPGEIAPKLALGMAYEMSGAINRAASQYELVAQSGSFVASAALGLARCCEQGNDGYGAAAAYELVPVTSSHYVNAQLGLASVLMSTMPDTPGERDLLHASEVLEGIAGSIDSIEVHEVRARLFRTAAEAVERGKVKAQPDKQLLSTRLVASGLRLGAERELRACARFAPTRALQIRYIDAANRLRPVTIV